VSEEEILGAIGFLYRCEGVIAEPAGAAAAAAYRKRPDPGGPVALLVTGRNITDELRRRAGLPLATASEPHR
jgi:threonine synthase